MEASSHGFYMPSSGRFEKQEQWEHWRAEWKLMPGSKHQGSAHAGVGGFYLRKIFGWKMVRTAVHNALLNILTKEQHSHAFPLKIARVRFSKNHKLIIKSSQICHKIVLTSS